MMFVFLTRLDDENLAAAALDLGPVAFVLKRSGGLELIKAINEILQGRWLSDPRLRAVDWSRQKPGRVSFQGN